MDTDFGKTVFLYDVEWGWVWTSCRSHDASPRFGGILDRINLCTCRHLMMDEDAAVCYHEVRPLRRLRSVESNTMMILALMGVVGRLRCGIHSVSMWRNVSLGDSDRPSDSITFCGDTRLYLEGFQLAECSALSLVIRSELNLIGEPGLGCAGVREDQPVVDYRGPWSGQDLLYGGFHNGPGGSDVAGPEIGVQVK